MRKNSVLRRGICWLFFAVVLLGWGSEAAAKVKISVFNYGTLNIEASGFGTIITNTLMTCLGCEPLLNIVERKELETFLSLNDLQQDDRLENVVNIGTRLGINMIIVGTVEKKGAVIVINSKVIQVEQKKVVFSNQQRVLGDAELVAEVKLLGKKIMTMINSQVEGGEGEAAKPLLLGGPVNVQLRGGNKCIHLAWEDPPGSQAVGYEIFRAGQVDGQFVRIGQASNRDYHDQNLEFDRTYHYKIRSISPKGVWSDYSAVACGKTTLTPNVPVILKAEGGIKSIQLTWSPNPTRSDDPLKVTGYKLYRARVEDWPREEVINITEKNVGAGESCDFEELQKVVYVDKGLADGVDYYYRLTAVNEKNLESEPCTALKGTTLPGVSRLTAQGNLIREVRLAWAPVNSPFIRGYNIYRSTSEGATFAKIKSLDASAVGSDKNIQYADRDGLADDVQYFYRVTAFDEGGGETKSLVTAAAITRKKPPVVQGVSARSGLVKKVEIAWRPSPSDDVEGYNLYWSREPLGGAKPRLLKRIEGRTAGNYSDMDHYGVKVEDNATYYYAMTSFNSLNVESEFSEAVTATTKARPVKPGGLRGESLKVKSTLLTWQANPEIDVAQYWILRATGTEEQDFSKVGKVQGKTEFADTDLKDGAVYLYRIQAEDQDGLLSDFSETIRVNTKPRPRSPEGLTGEFRQDRAVLRWNQGGETDLEHYVIYTKRFLGLDREKIATTREATYSDGTILGEKKKTYMVTAVDRDGLESEASREITVTVE